MGGYRARSGRSKTGYYRGIYCGSTYELAWVIYRLAHNLFVQRFDGYILYDKNKKYYPDFVHNDTIFEIKGWVVDKDILEKKNKSAEAAGYKIKILYKEDLEKEFKWVKENFKYTKIFELYDNYKPLYTYICDNCKINYFSDIKKKSSLTFCSRRCAGKFRKEKRENSNKKEFKEINCKRIFTKEEALTIYNDSKKSLQELANDYNVTKNAIWQLKNKKSYKWIHI